MNFNNAYMQDGQFLLKLTLEMTNYLTNKQDHAMKEKQFTFVHHHSLLSEDISRTDETSWKNEASETNI